MSGKEVWFRRGDGAMFVTMEGSSAYHQMLGSFTLVDEAGEVQEVEKAGKVDLTKMKKAELIAYAQENGIEVNPKATVAGIIEAIEAAEAEDGE